MITSEVDGLLFPPGDLAALAGVLRRLARDPGLRARLGAAARQRAGAYEPGAVAQEVVSFYRRLLGNLRTGKAERRPPGGPPFSSC